MSFSFGPEFRLHHSWEYRRFFQGSEVLRLSELVLFRLRNEQGHFRVGITVKAKVDSVRRNAVKRRIREAFRKLKHELGSYDYNVVVPSTKRVDAAYLERLRECLENEIKRSLGRFKPAR